MKNNFKASKCAIIAILTFCLLFCISGTQVFAAMAEGATVTIEENIVVAEDTTPELMPMKAQACSTYVPGIGWTGSQAWNNAIARVQEGGHIQGWGSAGLYLSESNARMLIGSAGLVVYGGVERDDYDHPYPHIHYWAKNSRHNSIRVLE